MAEGDPYYIDSVFMFSYDIVDFDPDNVGAYGEDIGLIRDALTGDKIGEEGVLDGLVGDNNHRFSAEDFLRKLDEVRDDDRALDLMAIGLWILRLKHQEKGFSLLINSVRKAFRGIVSLDDLVINDETLNCIESSVFCKRCAEIFGIDGVIKKFDGEMGHRYFVTNDGRVLSPFIERKTGGYFPTEEEYIRFCYKMGVIEDFV